MVLHDIFLCVFFFMKLRTCHCRLCGFLSQLLTGGHHLANRWSVELAWFHWRVVSDLEKLCHGFSGCLTSFFHRFSHSLTKSKNHVKKPSVACRKPVNFSEPGKITVNFKAIGL